MIPNQELVFSVAEMAKELISRPSLSGQEKEVLDYLFEKFTEWGWNASKLPVSDGRYNIFVPFGRPDILFTTHVDVVAAPAALFSPRLENGMLYGRGSCDAKGIAATMIAVCRKLSQAGKSNFALLLVVGEEVDGIGAKTAAEQLSGVGVRAVINGEPTEGKLAVAHKGLLHVLIKVGGRSAHSGYPHRGENANSKLIRIAARLLDADWGQDEVLGEASLNPGFIRGGVGINVVSPSAEIECGIRLVDGKEAALRKVQEIVAGEAEVKEIYAMPAVRMQSLPGFETCVVGYGTDVPSFLKLTKNCYLYGPGSIHVAHSNDEHLALADIGRAIDDYQRMYELLSK
jgi:acetylornithine deacetylase